MRGIITLIGLSLFTACDLSIDVKVDEEEPLDTEEEAEELCQSHVEVVAQAHSWNTNMHPGDEDIIFARMSVEVTGDTLMFHPLVEFDGPLVLRDNALVSNIHLVDSSGSSWNQTAGRLDMNGTPDSQRIQLQSFALPDGNWLLDLTATLSEDAWDGDEVQGSIILNESATHFTSPFECIVTGEAELRTVAGPVMTVRN
ncbi:MAG: hypothetical protein P8J32_03700 [bacterium]|jgi:hypothetical protein|nr:hypothetical protein [bacterium]